MRKNVDQLNSEYGHFLRSVQAHHPVEKNQILSIFLYAIYLYKELLCQLFWAVFRHIKPILL